MEPLGIFFGKQQFCDLSQFLSLPVDLFPILGWKTLTSCQQTKYRSLLPMEKIRLTTQHVWNQPIVGQTTLLTGAGFLNHQQYDTFLQHQSHTWINVIEKDFKKCFESILITQTLQGGQIAVPGSVFGGFFGGSNFRPLEDSGSYFWGAPQPDMFRMFFCFAFGVLTWWPPKRS